MHVYELTVIVDDDVVRAYEDFMRHQHVPALEATGCFQKVDFHRAEGRHYRLRLYANTEADLGRYLRDHARRLRSVFVHQLPHGVTLVHENPPGETDHGREYGFDRTTVVVERLRRATDL